MNAKDEVGIMVGWGGAHDNANTAEGILGDFVVWYHNGSDVTPDRFGDFITIRRSGRDGSEFAAFGYFTVKDAARTDDICSRLIFPYSATEPSILLRPRGCSAWERRGSAKLLAGQMIA